MEKMGDEFDALLLQILREGREIVDRDGERQIVQPLAADLNVIRQRLKDCGVTSVPVEDSPIANIVAEMAKRNLPALDNSDDAATA